MERLWERNRVERKETNSRAEYRNLEGRHEKSGWRERGDRGSESGDGHWGSNCEAELGREGKEEQRLSSREPSGSGRKKVEVREEPEGESGREAPEEQLWERNREG